MSPRRDSNAKKAADDLLGQRQLARKLSRVDKIRKTTEFNMNSRHHTPSAAESGLDEFPFEYPFNPDVSHV